MTVTATMTLLPAFLTGLIALGMILLGLRSRNRSAGLLVAAFAATLLATMTRHILGRLVLDPATYLAYDRPLAALFLFSLPVSVHLIHHQARLRRGRLAYLLLYGLMAVAAPFAAVTHFMVAGAYRSATGLISQPGPGMVVFAALSLSAGAIFLPIMLRVRPRSALSLTHQKAFVYGLLACLLLCFGDLLAGYGLIPLPPSVFCFLPLAAVTWSLLHADLSVTSREAIARGAANDVAFAVLLVAMAAAATALPRLFAGQALDDVLPRFFPNALPALLSTLVCFSIALASFAKGASNLGTLLFGISAALWGFYTADLALVATLSHPRIALWVSRVDHLGLVLNIPITFHASLSISGSRGHRRLLYLAYGLAALTLPFVLTGLYIPRMHWFWFGWFAQAGPVMQAYLTLGVVLNGFGVFLLVRASRNHPDERRRNLARYMSAAFGLALVLLVGNLPATQGIAVFPPAQFLFVPFVLAASGILMTRAVAFRTFLRVGLVRVLAMIVLSLGYALAIVMMADATAGARRWATVGVIALVTAVAFIPLVRHVWDWLSEPGALASGDGASRLRTLARRLAREPRREDSAKRIAHEVTEVLECDAALVLVGEVGAARLGGIRRVSGTSTPVLVWSDDPLIQAVASTAKDHPGPDVPAVNRGALFDLLPDLKLLSPIAFRGELVGLVAIGPRTDGRPHPQDAWEWLEALAERVAPYLRIHLYYDADEPDAMDNLSLPRLPDLHDDDDDERHG